MESFYAERTVTIFIPSIYYQYDSFYIAMTINV
jgi:hypothetical protein